MALVRVIIDKANALGLDVQAEGVELAAQQRVLTALGCPPFAELPVLTTAHAFSRPLTPLAFEQLAEQDGRVAQLVVPMPVITEQVS